VQPAEVEEPSTPSVLGWGLAGLAACVVAVGIVVFMRSRKV